MKSSVSPPSHPVSSLISHPSSLSILITQTHNTNTDHKGDIVVLTKIDPDKLPPSEVQLTYRVVTPGGHHLEGTTKGTSARAGAGRSSSASVSGPKGQPAASAASAATTTSGRGATKGKDSSSSTSAGGAGGARRPSNNNPPLPEYVPTATAGEFVRSEMMNLQSGTTLK